MVYLQIGRGTCDLYSRNGIRRCDVWTATLWLLIGLATVPGAFVARYLLRNVTPSGHSLFMEGVVFIGAIMPLVRGIS